jgi:cytochrome P450
VRSRLQLGLTPAVVHRLAGLIQRSAEELLDAVGEQKYLDVCEDYAFLLPAHVLSDLLGVRKEDRARVLQWSVAFIDFFNVIPITVETSRRLAQSALAMSAYTKALMGQPRSHPHDDFLGVLAAGQDEASGLTEDEIAGNVMLLLLAGHVALRNLIGNAVYLLLTHPDQRARLEAEPALVHNAIEETLRFEPPSH